jgi:hypothetical protein
MEGMTMRNKVKEIEEVADEICETLAKEILRAKSFSQAIFAGKAIGIVRMFENVEIRSETLSHD